MTQRERMAHLTRFMQEHPSDHKTKEPGSAALAGPLKRLTDQDYAELEGLREKVAQLSGRAEKVKEIELDQIDDSPFQIGPLDEKRVVKLELSLKANPWGNPILVRPKGDGRFETIAGHHRREAMRRLGHNTIESIVKEFTDDEAQRLVIYDNLLAPELSGYERYLGLKARAVSAKLTGAALARESGLSAQYISVLMLAFDELPAEAHELMKQKPDAISVDNGAELAKLSKTHPEIVVEAIRMVVNGEMDGSKAVRLARSKVDGGSAQREKPVKRMVKTTGRKNYAEITRTGGQIRIRLLRDEERSAELEKKVVELLQAMSTD